MCNLMCEAKDSHQRRGGGELHERCCRYELQTNLVHRQSNQALRPTFRYRGPVGHQIWNTNEREHIGGARRRTQMRRRGEHKRPRGHSFWTLSPHHLRRRCSHSAVQESRLFSRRVLLGLFRGTFLPLSMGWMAHKRWRARSGKLSGVQHGRGRLGGPLWGTSWHRGWNRDRFAG